MTTGTLRSVRGWLSLGHRPLLILLGVGLLIGLWVGRDYGMSVDEERNAGVGEAALEAYAGSPTYFWQPSLADHGPAYFMLFSTTSKLVNRIAPGWSLADGRHLTNYLMFLLAVASFYFLSLRFVSKRSAWIATALFATQPLLFGQAFINQKDIPFLALVLFSLATGLSAADRLEQLVTEGNPAQGKQGPRVRWHPLGLELQRLSSRRKILAALVVVTVFLITLDLVVDGLLNGIAEGLVVSAYNGRAPALVQGLFDRVATDAYKTPLSLYLDKLDVAWFGVRWLSPLGLVLAGWVTLSRFLPRTAQAWGWSPSQVLPLQWDWLLLATAILLGLTICVRQLGVFFGVLVSAYALYRGRARAVAPLALYWGVALAVTFATWPYLWPNPVSRFIGSVYLSANFPDTHVTLYRGAWLRAGTYPWYYFPNLAGIQLTEPAVIMILAGLAAAARKLLQRPSLAPHLLLVGAWFGGPLLGLIAFDLTTYGNITHLLFVLPAFFILAAMALEALLARIRGFWLRAALVALCLLPGIWGIARLHPFEYIYFNSFTGGVSGAANFYEMDRWCISIREATEEINRVAPPGATVMLPSSFRQAEPFARPDLRLVDNRTSYDEAQFVIDCTWIHTVGPWPSQEFQVIGEVKRGQAVLATIWQRTTTD